MQARGARPDEALDLDLAAGILRMPATMGQPAPGAPQEEALPRGTGFSYGEYAVEAAPATQQLAGPHRLATPPILRPD